MQQLRSGEANGAVAPRRRILICDDECEIADMVASLMEREGFSCRACYDPRKALEMMKENPFDLVILDIMMPGMDGYELARRIRALSNVPLIFLSAKDEEIDSVLGFAVGADDYVTKPFRPRELGMRVRACLRRALASASPAPSGLLSMRGIELDPRSHEASLHGKPLSLTPKEFELLRVLMEAGGEPRSAAELFECVWGERADAAASNTVMVHVRHVRQKLAAIDSSFDFIVTVWGVGYRMNAE
ncbi:response regulator transcription factor [Slackia piriformis]|uniref:response regulator transcription factor n=1 Tax=Slackia piriformis TaxID=626934 RepID=UPI0026DC5188|nr:response regulator transcription factor [Slackia piriformis]MDO5023317.1 response regulator transcription factor [Slackia piriformis]